jgi:hypothetical protein
LDVIDSQTSLSAARNTEDMDFILAAPDLARLPGLEIVEQGATTIDITLRAPNRILGEIRPASLVARVAASWVMKG